MENALIDKGIIHPSGVINKAKINLAANVGEGLAGFL
jgi:hypothetical protein